jgi:hypothetical protein
MLLSNIPEVYIYVALNDKNDDIRYEAIRHLRAEKHEDILKQILKSEKNKNIINLINNKL